MSEPFIASQQLQQQQQQSKGGAVETISQLLSCYICADTLRDASLCPHCAQMSCYSCIKKWVTNNRADCPHCRAPLTESSIIRLRIFDDFVRELRQLPSNPLEGNPQFRDRLCPQHKEKVAVYCKTCRLCVCYECVLWENSPHHNHIYFKMDTLIGEQTKICQAELRRLHEHLKKVLSQVQSVERKMEAVKGSKIKVQREMRETFEKMMERLESQHENKQHRLGETQQKLKGQAMQLTRATMDLENTIKTGSVSRLLGENGELRDDVLHKLKELQSIEIESIPSIGELYNEMVPNYSTSVFKLHPYSQLKQLGEEKYSKPLCVGGTVWKLKIYPNGHREDTGIFLGVFLELTEGYEKSIKYQYCIEMLYNCSNKHPSRNYKKEYASDFVDGESWGYRKFYELSKLGTDGFLRDDTLILRFSVRPLTNHQKCRELSTHVRRLEHKIEKLQNELKQTKERPSSAATSSSSNHEDVPASVTNSPSRHHHQHSFSEPVSPGPNESSSPHSSRGGQDQRRNEHERRRSNEEQRHDQNNRQYDHQDRRREGGRRRGEGGRYRDHLSLSMSQHHSIHTQHQSNQPQQSQQQQKNSKRRSYHAHQRHGDSRMMAIDPPPPQPINYHSQKHRLDSGDSNNIREHRRYSADPAHFQRHLENPISPPVYRHTLAPPTISHGSSSQQLQFRRDSFDDGEFGSQSSLLTSPSRYSTGEFPRHFEEGSGGEEGSSQPHVLEEPISHNDIHITVQDHSVAPHPPVMPHHTQQYPPQFYLASSQEMFIDDEDINGPGKAGGMLAGPHSSQLPHYDMYDEAHIQQNFKSSDMPSHTSALSQPVHSSRRRLQSSVPDLSALTETSSSNLAQGLSQSVLEISRFRGDHTHGLRLHHDVPRSIGRSSYQSHLNRIPSDPHLNSEVVHHPGLARTILGRLKEEPEGSPGPRKARTVGGVSSGSQHRSKRYQNMRRTPSPQPNSSVPTTQQSSQQVEIQSTKPVSTTTSGGNNSGCSSGNSGELTPTNSPQLSLPPSNSDTAAVTLTTGSLSLAAGKSNSNTSLSIKLI